MRTHTSEKPFRCEFCGETFTASAGLRKHMKKFVFLVFRYHDTTNNTAAILSRAEISKRIRKVSVNMKTHEHYLLKNNCNKMIHWILIFTNRIQRQKFWIQVMMEMQKVLMKRPLNSLEFITKSLIFAMKYLQVMN